MDTEIQPNDGNYLPKKWKHLPLQPCLPKRR